MLYRDIMDTSRTLEPTGKQGANPRHERCRVFFDGFFAGFADVSKVLFGNERIGFVLVDDSTSEVQ